MKRQDRQFRITKFQGKAIAVAISALFGALGAQNAMAENIPDAGTVANTTATTVVFTGTSGVLTGIATVADGNSILAVSSNNANNTTGTGTLTFLGAATGTGTVGSVTNIIGLVNFNGIVGKTVSLTGDVFAANIAMGAGTFSSGGSVTSAINYAADGTISMAAGKIITGAVTNTTTGQGTLTFAATSASATIATAAIGNTGGGPLKAINVAPATTFTSTFAAAVKATTITHSGAGTVAFASTAAGDIKITGGGLITGGGVITGTVDNTGTAGTGTLTMSGGFGVTGNIGATNALAAVATTSGTTAFGGTVKATNINLNATAGTDNATFAGDVTGIVNFKSNSANIATIAADKKIVGSVATDNDGAGVLTFGTATAASTVLVSGAVGAGGGLGPLALLALNVDSGTAKAVSFGGAVFARTVTLAGTGTTTVTGDITAATTVNFTGNGTLTLGANSKVVGNVATGTADFGTLTFGATTANTTLVSGTTGAGTKLLAVTTAVGTGATGTFTGAVTASTVNINGVGTVAFTNGVTASTGVNFGADGIVSLAADKAVTGAVNNTTAGQGTLNIAATTANNTVVTGITGSTGTGLKAVNITSGVGTTGATFTGLVKATTITQTGAGVTTFTGGATGAVRIAGGGTITSAEAITGSVDNTGTTGQGTLTMSATKGVTGAIGATAALAMVTSDGTGGTSAFGGAIKATNISLAGTGIATFAGNLTGAVNFAANGTATIATGVNIIGAVTNTTTGQGTLNFAGTTTTGGDIGVTGGGPLLATNFAAGTVSIGHNITAATIGFNGTSSTTFTAAKTLTGATTVAAGATLDVGTVGVTNTGAFTTNTGTTLKTSLITATTTGQYAVTGTGTIVAGTKVFVNVGTIAVVDGQRFKLVNSTAGTGANDLTAGNVTTNSAVLSFTARAGADGIGAGAFTGAASEDLYLVAARVAGGFTTASGISTTAPGATGLTALNTIALAVPAVGSDMALVVNTFNGYSAAQLLTEAPKLAPTTGAAATGAGMGTVSQSLNLVSTRLASIRGDSSQLASGVAASGVAAGSAPGREVWVKGFGNNSSQGAFGGFAGYSGRSYGLAFGADTNMGSNTRLGLGMSYAKTNVGWTSDGNAGAGSNVSVNSYQLTGYGSRDFGQVYVDGMLSYARHNTSGNRLAALARQATYSTNANQWTGRIGAGYRIPMGGKTVFTPLASLEWSNFNQNAYTESGAGALNLNVDGLRVNRTKGGVGFRVSGESTMAGGTVFKPELHMGVYNDFNNGAVATTSSFTGGAGSFSTQGQSVQRTSYNVGAGVTFLQGRSGSVGVVYDYEARSSFKGHNFQVQGRWTF